MVPGTDLYYVSLSCWRRHSWCPRQGLFIDHCAQPPAPYVLQQSAYA